MNRYVCKGKRAPYFHTVPTGILCSSRDVTTNTEEVQTAFESRLEGLYVANLFEMFPLCLLCTDRTSHLPGTTELLNTPDASTLAQSILNKLRLYIT